MRFVRSKCTVPETVQAWNKWKDEAYRLQDKRKGGRIWVTSQHSTLSKIARRFIQGLKVKDTPITRRSLARNGNGPRHLVPFLFSYTSLFFSFG